MEEYKRVNLEKRNVGVTQKLHQQVKVTIDANSKKIDLKEAYYMEHYDIRQLLDILKEYVKLDMINGISMRPSKQLEVIFLDAGSWELDNFEIEYK